MPASSSSSHQTFPTAVQWSHLLLQPRLQSGMVVVDATAGNGHDTLFLAQHIFPGGQLFVFDVQEAALQSTRQRLVDHQVELDHVQLIHAGHEQLSAMLPAELRGQLSAVMFNLGYLPGGDKNRITLPDSSLNAIRQALEWIAPNGLVTVVVYPGHDGGREEAQLIEAHFQTLSSEFFEIQKIAFVNYRQTTPFLLAVRKKKQQQPT